MNEQILDQNIEKLLSASDIPVINSDVNYWFVRTSSGKNFENFYFGSYIAIGWDSLNNISQMMLENHNTLKEQVENFYPDDSKPGSTASQILRFVCEMNPGDYVLIPSENCNRIAIGIITSDAYIHEPTESEKFEAYFEGTEVEFLKRRDVQWITDAPFERSELDPMLIPIIYSYGTIINANPYSDFINRTIYDLYYRNGELHAIFNITKKDNISAYEFNTFINNIFDALDVYSDISESNVDKQELMIKASINSPGPVEIITAAVSAFIFLSGLSLFLNGAKVKLTYNILKLASGEININSPGLIDQIKKLNKSSANNDVKLAESQKKLTASKEELKIKKKDKKK